MNYAFPIKKFQGDRTEACSSHLEPRFSKRLKLNT